VSAEGITLPFKAVALMNEHGRTRLDVTVKASLLLGEGGGGDSLGCIF
jgi:hypothetical protein